jgi:hypothetical protein
MIFLEFGEKGAEVRENNTVEKVYLLSSTKKFSVPETGI